MNYSPVRCRQAPIFYFQKFIFRTLSNNRYFPLHLFSTFSFLSKSFLLHGGTKLPCLFRCQPRCSSCGHTAFQNILLLSSSVLNLGNRFGALFFRRRLFKKVLFELFENLIILFLCVSASFISHAGTRGDSKIFVLCKEANTSEGGLSFAFCFACPTSRLPQRLKLHYVHFQY